MNKWIYGIILSLRVNLTHSVCLRGSTLSIESVLNNGMSWFFFISNFKHFVEFLSWWEKGQKLDIVFFCREVHLEWLGKFSMVCQSNATRNRLDVSAPTMSKVFFAAIMELMGNLLICCLHSLKILKFHNGRRLPEKHRILIQSSIIIPIKYTRCVVVTLRSLQIKIWSEWLKPQESEFGSFPSSDSKNWFELQTFCFLPWPLKSSNNHRSH